MDIGDKVPQLQDEGYLECGAEAPFRPRELGLRVGSEARNELRSALGVLLGFQM